MRWNFALPTHSQTAWPGSPATGSGQANISSRSDRTIRSYFLLFFLFPAPRFLLFIHHSSLIIHHSSPHPSVLRPQSSVLSTQHSVLLPVLSPPSSVLRPPSSVFLLSTQHSVLLPARTITGAGFNTGLGIRINTSALTAAKTPSAAAP